MRTVIDLDDSIRDKKFDTVTVVQKCKIQSVHHPHPTESSPCPCKTQALRHSTIQSPDSSSATARMMQHLLKLRRVASYEGIAQRLPQSQRLYKIDEVDEYQRHNPYIRSGYRHKLDWLSCLLSTFSVHNETVNIWTHLLGFVFFCGLLVRDLLLVPSHLQLLEKIALSDLLVLAGVLVCYQACMVLSSVFHTFTCHSQRVSERCLSLDLVGITLALLATYLSGIYYAFWCQPSWRDFHLAMVGGIFLLAAGMQLSPKFAVDEYAAIRVGLFMVWAIYGVVPTLHWIHLHGGFASAIVRLMLPR